MLLLNSLHNNFFNKSHKKKTNCFKIEKNKEKPLEVNLDFQYILKKVQ